MHAGPYRLTLSTFVALCLASVSGCAESFDKDPDFPTQESVGETSAPRTPPQQPTMRVASAVQGTAAPAPQGEAGAAGPPAFSPPTATPGVPPSGAQGSPEADSYEDTDPSALSDFRPALDPYGTWADDEHYGVVWTPSPTAVGDGFVPYMSSGHWVYENDYVWVSDYAWGWAPFHYGRWVYLERRGWSWIPGRRYAGAWVTWRVGDDGFGYVGWAPLAPTWYWRGGYPAYLYGAPAPYYVYCPSAAIFYPGVSGYVVHGPAAVAYTARTRPYVPATPVVNGVAGGHVAASPTVNPGTTPGHGPASPSAGPPPRLLGAPVPSTNAAVAARADVVRAQAFARPSTAVALGARAPVYSSPVSRVNVVSPAGVAPRPDSSVRGIVDQRMAPVARSSYAGGPSTTLSTPPGAVFRSPPSTATAMPYHPPSTTLGGGGAPAYTAGRVGAMPQAPVYRAPSQAYSAPAHVVAPSGGAFHPSYGGYSHSSGGSTGGGARSFGGGSHGGGGHHR